MVTEGTRFCWQQGPVQKRLFPDKTRGRKIGQYRFTSQEILVLLWDLLLLITGRGMRATDQNKLLGKHSISVNFPLHHTIRQAYFFFCASTLFSFHYLLVQHGILLKSQQSYSLLQVKHHSFASLYYASLFLRTSLIPKCFLSSGCPPSTPYDPFSSVHRTNSSIALTCHFCCGVHVVACN